MSVAFQIPACAENRRREKHLEYARAHVTSVTCVARNDLLFTMSDNTRAGALWGSRRANLFFSRTSNRRLACRAVARNNQPAFTLSGSSAAAFFASRAKAGGAR